VLGKGAPAIAARGEENRTHRRPERLENAEYDGQGTKKREGKILRPVAVFRNLQLTHGEKG